MKQRVRHLRRTPGTVKAFCGRRMLVGVHLTTVQPARATCKGCLAKYVEIRIRFDDNQEALEEMLITGAFG